MPGAVWEVRLRCLTWGTGCGLIALMVAQRNKNCEIDAIDIDADAIAEAKINIDNSPGQGRFKRYCDRFQ